MPSSKQLTSFISTLYELEIIFPNFNAVSEPRSSRRGIVVAANGATFDLDAKIFMEIQPSSYLYLAYITAPYTISDASVKTCSKNLVTLT